MASGSKSSTKRDVEGFIHQVSEVKIPASGSRYFDFTLQERDEKHSVVCFHPDKRDDLKQKEESKSPVRILNVSPQKRKFQPDSVEYKLERFSKVQVTKNLSFPWKDQSSEEATIKNIMDSGKEGEMMSLRCKVLSKSESQIVFSHAFKRDLKKCQLVVADQTGAIPITIWEDMISQVDKDKSYIFSNLKVSFYRFKYLNAVKASKVQEISDTSITVSEEICKAAAALAPKETESEDVSGKILAIDVNKVFVCVNCNSKISDYDEEDEFLKCRSCKLTMLKSRMSSAVSANIVIEQGGESIGWFFCSGNVLNEMFISISETKNYKINETDVTKLSKKMISETLLLINQVTFKVSKEEKVVVSMNVIE